jgi:CDP-glucose 4,6-dehydratase
MALRPAFWSGRRVLLTGHTGFKGAWTARWLARLGAEVTGLALAPEGEPNLFRMLEATTRLRSCIGDLRDPETVRGVVARSEPEIVLHMAAQALVPRGYREPVATWSSNVMGTVTLLDALRGRAGLKAIVVVTSDKVYANREGAQPFRESDPLGGDDPYSASKAATELAVASWRASFAAEGPSVATARAGNVIGGGDWSADRLVPDLVCALEQGRPLDLRQPESTRPWQHVLDPLAGYLMLAEQLAQGKALPDALNFGPASESVLPTRVLVERLSQALGHRSGWRHVPRPEIPERPLLALDAGLAERTLGWRPRLAIGDAVAWTAEWYGAQRDGADVAALTERQIERYEAL